MTSPWSCFEVGRDDAAFMSMHREFEAAVRASWTSPKQVLVRDWIWPEHLSEIDRIGVEDRLALVLPHDGSPAGAACCRCDRAGRSEVPGIDFLYLKRALQERGLWREAIVCIRDWLIRYAPARARTICFGSNALGRFAGDGDALQRLGFAEFEEYGYFAVDLDTTIPEVAEPAGYALVPWRDEYRSRIEQMSVEMPLILGGLIESRRLRLDRRASRVALQGEEVCGAILVREPAASGSSFVDYLLVAEPHRRRGLGRALEVRTMAYLKARGITSLGSCVAMSNTAMRALKKELQGVPLGFADLSCAWHAPE